MYLLQMYGNSDNSDTTLREVYLTVSERANDVLNTHVLIAALMSPGSSFVKTLLNKDRIVFQSCKIRRPTYEVIDDATKLPTYSGMSQSTIISQVKNEQDDFGEKSCY